MNGARGADGSPIDPVASESGPKPRDRWWASRSLVGLWLATIPAWSGWAASTIVIGWLAFASTNSPAVVGLAYAVRLAPLALVAVPAGAASDRLGRLPMMVASNIGSGICAGGLAMATSFAPDTRLLVALIAAAALGSFDAIRLVTSANVAYDAVPRDATSRAIGLSNLFAGIGQALGALVGGALIDVAGPAGASIAVAALYFLAVVPLVAAIPRASPAESTTSSLADVREGIRLARQIPVVRTLVVVAVVVEMLGFAGMALDPVFAGDVFKSGALGLGLLAGTRACGRLLGSIGLGLVRLTRLAEPMAAAVILFGLALIGLAVSPSIWLALPAVALAGVAGVSVDSLEQTALQAGVSDSKRGSAAGLWVFSLGLGPLGIGLLTILAQLIGARGAQAVSGAAVLAFGLLIAWGRFGRSLRDLNLRGPTGLAPEGALPFTSVPAARVGMDGVESEQEQ